MGRKSKITKEGLYHLYIDEDLSSSEIAEKLNVSNKTIARWLSNYDIKPKPKWGKKYGLLRDKNWVENQYTTLCKSTISIGRELGITPRTIYEWIVRHNIPTRPRSQNKGKQFSEQARQNMSKAKKGKYTGSSNPNWKGGEVSEYARERNRGKAKAWSIAIKKRDNFKCQHCGARGKLHSHHIKSFKDHPELRYELSNGITLCPPCHQKVHGFPFPKWAYQDEIPTSAEHS